MCNLVTIDVVLAVLGLLLAAGGAGAGVVYGYGRLTHRADSMEEDLRNHAKDFGEIFERLRGIEKIAPALTDAVNRLEKILSNGITSKVASMENRMTRLEQHCADVHGRWREEEYGREHATNSKHAG